MKSVGLSPSPIGFWLTISLVVILACVVIGGLVHIVRKCILRGGNKQYTRDSIDDDDDDDDDDTSQSSEENEEAEGWRVAVNEMLSSWVPPLKPGLDDEQSFVTPTPPSPKQKDVHVLPTPAPPRTKRKDAQVSPKSTPPKPKQKDVQVSPTSTPPNKPKRMDVDLSPAPAPGRKDHQHHKRRRGEKKKGRVKPPREGPDAGQLVRQRTEELGNAVTEKLDQALTGLSVIGNDTKEFAEKTSKNIGDGASNAVIAIGETSKKIGDGANNAVIAIGETSAELLMGLGSGSQASSSCSSGGDTSFGASVSSGTSSGDDSASTSLASHDTYYIWGGKLNLTGSASTESISRSTKSQEESVSSDSYCTSSDDDDDDSLASVGSGKVLNVPAAPNVSGEKKYATTPATTPDEISATASYDRYLPSYNYACM